MSGAAKPLSGRRVLIGEDEYLIARDLEHLLIDAGCAKVWIASSIADCARIVGENALDAAVLDLWLNDGDASELARQMSADGLPIVFITGYEHTAIPPGLDSLPVLAKPFPRRHLLHALDLALARGGSAPTQ